MKENVSLLRTYVRMARDFPQNIDFIVCDSTQFFTYDIVLVCKINDFHSILLVGFLVDTSSDTTTDSPEKTNKP